MHKNKDYDAICIGQLRSTSKGHQGMVQTRSMTRTAEETSRSLHGHLRAFGPRTMMMMMSKIAIT